MTGGTKVKRGMIRLLSGRAMVALLSVLVGLAAVVAPTAAKPLEASIVIDAATGVVISASNPDVPTYPASLTKMMTLYMLFDALKTGRIGLDDRITFSNYSASQPATNLAADPGDSIRVETAILALIVRSANDVAAAVGERLAGSESAFARKMTEKARAMGMSNTSFRNASGLPDSGQKTTARDMAILGLALLGDFPEYYGYFSRNSFTYGGVSYTGHNRLLNKFAGADGIKTGYIRASGFNLVSSAEREGRRLVGVVLGGSSPSSRDRWMMRLLEKGFAGKGAVKDVLVAVQSPNASDDPVAALLAATTMPEILPRLRPGSALAQSSSPALDDQEIVNVWNGINGDFGIQVGAFARQTAARKAADNAAKALPELLGDARIVVDAQKTGNGGTLYRARVIGLSRPAAEQACRDLARRSTDCLVLKTGSSLAMGG